MRVVGVYSFNGGCEVIAAHFAAELREVEAVIAAVDNAAFKTKTHQGKTTAGKSLYNPHTLNRAFKTQFEERGWYNHRVTCEYPAQYYVSGYQSDDSFAGAFREIDFVKQRMGIEVQFCKYACMIYDICAKMTIFHKLGVIDAGIQIVPVKELVNEMPVGIPCFEQCVWDLEQRGVSTIDIPLLVLGISHE
jgi:hypothetical protein